MHSEKICHIFIVVLYILNFVWEMISLSGWGKLSTTRQIGNELEFGSDNWWAMISLVWMELGNDNLADEGGLHFFLFWDDEFINFKLK